MRRWNGWGDDSTRHAAPAGLVGELVRLLGEGVPPPELDFTEALSRVEAQASRLSPHPLLSTEPQMRLRHARGQSFADLVALRSGLGLTFADAVATPGSRDEVDQLIAFAKSADVEVIPIGG